MMPTAKPAMGGPNRLNDDVDSETALLARPRSSGRTTVTSRPARANRRAGASSQPRPSATATTGAVGSSDGGQAGEPQAAVQADDRADRQPAV
jgi:hypothetical protein